MSHHVPDRVLVEGFLGGGGSKGAIVIKGLGRLRVAPAGRRRVDMNGTCNSTTATASSATQDGVDGFLGRLVQFLGRQRTHAGHDANIVGAVAGGLGALVAASVVVVVVVARLLRSFRSSWTIMASAIAGNRSTRRHSFFVSTFRSRKKMCCAE